MNTQEVVDKYFETVNAGDWETWLTLFDKNIVMDEQLAGRIEGIKALQSGVGGLEKGYSKFQNHPLQTIIEGDEASVIWQIDAANASGVPIEAKGANFFRVQDGKITYMANFHDTVPFAPFVNQDLD